MKKTKVKTTHLTNSSPVIKYVKKANAWVTTSFKDGKQLTTWSINKPPK